ncbi:MAG: thiol-disulfide oxidoreductase DCC family protein [Acidobacteriota bacterium]|nr:thiol-disulfide oxidoreductase DCC family protein [Acidobacteriota bacterium]
MGAIVLFDGVCNFCNSSVNFVIQHDRKGYFKFAPLQSTVGWELLNKYKVETSKADSVVVIDDGRVYLRSDGALHVAGKLDKPWSWLSFLIIVPRPIRDFIYRLLAKYRYRLFGKKDVCMIPTPELKQRFL